jgi:hypothetical protein
MTWLDHVARDPVPWLLDPANPSARFLTLKHIFEKPASRLIDEGQRILDWAAVKQLRHHWSPTNFWGRADNPYYGGQAGDFGTLYLLAQLSAPRCPEIEATCENLLARGRRADGHFAPEGAGAAPWHSYASMALHILTHFGFSDDPRVQSAWKALTEGIQNDPNHVGCVMGDRACRAGAVKALSALIHCGVDAGLPADPAVTDSLANYLLTPNYDWEQGDAEWGLPRFPRFYDTDLIELCHVVAHTSYQRHHRFLPILQRMIHMQDQEGRWSKLKATHILSEERIFHPSRWLTFEAVHSLMLIYGDEMYAP